MSERPDPLAAGLAALAPTIDVAAGRRLFERHRSRPGATRRWLLPAAVATLLIAGVVGVWAARQAEAPDRVPSAPVDETDEADETGGAVGDGYELLAVAQTSRSAGSVQIAITDEDVAGALEGTGVDPQDVDVDLSRSIVGVLNVAGNPCPLGLDGFDVSGAVWSPRLVESGQACDDIGVTWTYVVAIDRHQLGGSLTLRLPSTLGGGEATVELETDRTITVDPDEPAAVPATGEEFVMLAVEATQLEFGSILVADDSAQLDRMWSESFAEAEQPPVDFDHLLVVAFTLPDDACPDTLTRFTIGQPNRDAPAIWEPQFEPPPGGCRLPLITRTYVVGVDRTALGTTVTFRLPGDDVYDFTTNTVTVDVSPPDSPPDSATPSTSPMLTSTGVRVPLPPVGEPQIAVGTFGVVWVVHHANGTVSVLDAVVDRPVNDDEGSVSRLADVVSVSILGDAFSTAGTTWDAWGRAINRPRTDDLVGYAGRVVGGEVEVLLSDATTIAGSPEPIFEPAHVPPDLDAIPLLDLGTLPALSFSGPIWRHLDATLVVENGVGSLCPVDQDLPVPDLATCDDGVATAVRSTQPEITSWYFGPVLAEFDEFGRIVQVVPLGGRSSRNDGPAAAGDQSGGVVDIQQVTFDCEPPEDAAVEVRLLPAVPGEPVTALVQVVGGGSVRGETSVHLSDGSPATIRVEIDSGSITPDGTIIVRSSDDPDLVFDETAAVGCA